MARRAKKDFSVEGLHWRETASKIEQKFARPANERAGTGTRRTRRQKSAERVLETVVVDASLIDSSARKNVTPAFVTFISQMVRHGLEAGDLHIVDGVVCAVDEVPSFGYK